MTTTQLSPLPIQHFVDNNGNALTGGLLFTYAAGTVTKTPTYTDSTGNTANTNPVILNSRGEANVWLTPGVGYKFVLSPSTDTDPPTNPIWTVDQIFAAGSGGAAFYFGTGVTTGSANAQVLSTTSPSGFTLTLGSLVAFLSGFTNTGATTLNVLSTGSVSILKRTAGGLVALTAGDLLTNQWYLVEYDGTEWQLLNADGDSGFASIASASTTNIGAAGNPYLRVTGTTTITAFDTVPAGCARALVFAGSLALTNSVSLILPGGANITTSAGDVATFRSEGSGVWRCSGYSFASGGASVSSGAIVGTARQLTGSAAGGSKNAAWSIKEIVAKTALGGTPYVGSSLGISFSGSGTGAGGMDISNTPLSSDLYVYAIFNPGSPTWNTLGTVTPDAGNNVYQGSNPVSGYTASALLWSGKTDPSGNILPFQQVDRGIWFGGGRYNALSIVSSVATSFSNVTISPFIPANARHVWGILGGVAGVDSNGVMSISADTSGTAEKVYAGYVATSSPSFEGFSTAAPFENMPIITAQIMFYKSQSSSNAVRIDLGGYDI